MVEPAQLGAPPGEGALAGGGQVEGVLAARDDVHLEVELRDPERVDDVGRPELEAHRLVDREPQLGWVRGRAGVEDVVALGGVLVEVVEAPLPLAADDGDRVVGVLDLFQHVVLRGDGVEEEDGHDDDRRDRVQRLDRQVVAHLRRHLVVAATAVPDHRVDHAAEDEHEDDEHGDPGAQPEIPHRVGAIAAGHREGEALHVGVVDGRTAAQHEHGGGERHQLHPTHGTPS